MTPRSTPPNHLPWYSSAVAPFGATATRVARTPIVAKCLRNCLILPPPPLWMIRCSLMTTFCALPLPTLAVKRRASAILLTKCPSCLLTHRWGPRNGSSEFFSHLATTFERATQRREIGIFDIAAHRNSVGNARDPNPERFDEPSQVEGRRLPLGGWVGGDDHLADAGL